MLKSIQVPVRARVQGWVRAGARIRVRVTGTVSVTVRIKGRRSVQVWVWVRVRVRVVVTVEQSDFCLDPRSCCEVPLASYP